MDSRHFQRRIRATRVLRIALIRGVTVAAVWLWLCTGLAWAEFGDVTSYTLILAPDPTTTRTLFGSAVAPLGDLDGDGNSDLAVGAAWDNDGAVDVTDLVKLLSGPRPIP